MNKFASSKIIFIKVQLYSIICINKYPKSKKFINMKIKSKLSLILISILLTTLYACNNSESVNNDIDIDKVEVIKNIASIHENNSLISNIKIELNSPAKLYIKYENTRAGKFKTQTTNEAKKLHDFAIMRLKPNSNYSYEIIVIDNNTIEKIIGKGEFTTGDLPEALKSIETVATGNFTPELLLSEIHIGPPLNLTESYMFMLDQDSEIVWYYLNKTMENHKPLMILAISQKEDYNLTFNLGSPFDYCCIREITPSGKTVDNLPSGPVDGVAHREHLLLDNNKILYSAYEYRKIDDTNISGNSNVPVAGFSLRIWDQASGLTTEVWNSFDSIGIENRHHWTEILDRWPQSGFYNRKLSVPELVKHVPWTSANSIQKASNGNYIISIPDLSQIISISEDFKQIFWRLGGKNSDFRFEDPTNKFYHQHTAQQLPNGNILLFDNGQHRPEEEGGTYSRALELTMNTYDRIANKVWEYVPEPKIYAPNRSSAYRLNNGNTLINFVNNPRTIVEVDENGNEIYKATMKTKTDQGSFRVYSISTINGETKIK